MAAVASPYGFKPVNRIGGLPYAGSTRSFAFDPAGYAANVYTGSLVYIKSTGYIELVSATGADATTNSWPVGSTDNTGTIGVFVGCSYTNSMGQTVFGQYYPANALNGVAIVVDDPDCVFQVQSAGTVTIAALGANTFMTTGAVLTGSTATGNSTASIVIGSSALQTTAPLRIIGFVDMRGFSAVGDAFTDVLVKINPGWHSYNTVKGV
jgi:hypothetical protein